MIWFFLGFCFLIYTIFDSKKRKGIDWGFAIGNGLPGVGVFVMPFYLAQRPLIDSEVRHGGMGWNVCRYFAITWTIAMGMATFAGMAGAGEAMSTIDSDAGRAGAAIGVGLGLGMLFCIWISGAAGAMLIGLMLKNSAIVEQAAPSALTRAGARPTSQAPAARPAAAPARPAPAPRPAPAAPVAPAAPPPPASQAEIMISVARAGGVIGTYPKSEFARKMATGEFLPTDHYWYSGMAAWDTVSNFRG